MNITDENRQEAAVEMVGIGEQLFALALEGHAQLTPEDVRLVEELRAAADEFFAVLRVLLRINEA